MAAGQLNGTAGAEEERPSTPRRSSGHAPLGTNGEVSRRALLGAAFSVPVLCHPELGSGSSSPPPGRGISWTLKQVQGDAEWEAALAGFRLAETALARVEAASAGYRFDEEEEVLPGHMAACESLSAAVRRVIRAAVPDVAGLALKVELVFAHEVEPYSIDGEVIAAVRGDLRRLAAGLASVGEA